MSRRVRIRTRRSALRRALAVALGTAATGIVIGAVLVVGGLPTPLGPRVREPEPTVVSPATIDPPRPATPRPKREVTLFFLDRASGRLVPERRSVDQETGIAPQARRALEALLAGPADETAPRLFAQDVKLLALFVDPKGEAFLDLSASAARPAGVEDELLTLASLALTLTRNFPEIERIHVLLEGHETTTLRGHLSMDYPLLAKDPVYDALVLDDGSGIAVPLPPPSAEPVGTAPSDAEPESGRARERDPAAEGPGAAEEEGPGSAGGGERGPPAE